MRKIKFIFNTLTAKEMRYSTIGDWKTGEVIEIISKEFKNPDHEFLVLLHEFIECYLCMKRGITDEEVTRFDMQFEKDRKKKLHTKSDEPGNDIKAPYWKEHQFATGIEQLLATELGINWQQYEKSL